MRLDREKRRVYGTREEIDRLHSAVGAPDEGDRVAAIVGPEIMAFLEAHTEYHVSPGPWFGSLVPQPRLQWGLPIVPEPA